MAEMKKLIVKLDIHDDCDKRKVLKVVAGILGLNSVEVDLKAQKLTATGDFDPIKVVKKLRKQSCHTEVVSLGPAKKDDGGGKKEEKGDKKEDKGDKKEGNKGGPDPSKYYCYPSQPIIYYCLPADEYPSTCVIC